LFLLHFLLALIPYLLLPYVNESMLVFPVWGELNYNFF
jgi:hypothetical protein